MPICVNRALRRSCRLGLSGVRSRPMGGRRGHLRGIEGGGETEPAAAVRYSRREATAACSDPDASLELIFAAFPTSTAHGEWEFSRALATRLVADADAQAPAVAELFVRTALVDGWRAQHVVWEQS